MTIPAVRTRERARGKLKIGDDWNAITIIALSQSNPLKAIAELVENSIDAKARSVTITRGREHGRHFLAIRDDGEGVPRDSDGRPDFHYVATHICDSIKRRLKTGGVTGLQGEFGIGLLSFWTVGEEITMTSAGADQRVYQMIMRKGDPGYTVSPRRALFSEGGTEVRIAPLLEGTRSLSGEKIQWYLAAELRDRIRQTGVKITVIDRLARKQYAVEPRQYEGRLLHELPVARTPFGDIYAELYLNEPTDKNAVALFRHGTRVLEDIALLDDFAHPPWTLRYLQGHLDAPFINLTPGTRTGLRPRCFLCRPLRRIVEPGAEARARLSKSSAALKKNKPAVNCCAQYNAPFEKPCWPCLRKNTTGSIFRFGLRGQCQVLRRFVSAPISLEWESKIQFPERRNRSGMKTNNGSFSNSQGRCSALRSRPHPVSSASAQAVSFVRCRAIVPDAASNRICSSIGKS